MRIKTLAFVLLVAITLALLVVPFVAAEPRTETVRATRFGYVGDRWAGRSLRCLGRPMVAADMVIAHRTLPCGTLVRVTSRRTGRSVVAVVADRGPYGAVLPDGTWTIKRRRADPGVWRGGADLSTAVVEALGHRSFDRVTLTVLPPAPRP